MVHRAEKIHPRRNPVAQRKSAMGLAIGSWPCFLSDSSRSFSSVVPPSNALWPTILRPFVRPMPLLRRYPMMPVPLPWPILTRLRRTVVHFGGFSSCIVMWLAC